MTAWDLVLFYLRGDSGGDTNLYGRTRGDTLTEALREAAVEARDWLERTGSDVNPNVPVRLFVNGLKGPLDVPGLDGSLSVDEIVTRVEAALAEWESAQSGHVVADFDSPFDPDPDPRSPRYDVEGGDLHALWNGLAAAGALGDSRTPGASSIELDDAEQATGVTWPDDLRLLFSLQAGITEVIPGFRLIPLDESMASWRLWMRINDETFAQWPEGSTPDEDLVQGVEAGTTVEMFVPELIPIAEDNTGVALCFDVRGGALTGCVVEYSAESGGSTALWASIAAMIREVTESVRTGTPLHQQWQPIVTGKLDWERVS